MEAATKTLRAHLQRFNLTYVRYGAASVIALASDVALFWVLLSSGLESFIAAGAGYGFGILVHWLISSRLVFADETHERGSSARRKQKVLFALSAFVGLVLTMIIVSFGVRFGLDPRVAKLVAIVVSFQAVWFIRRMYVFAK